MLVSDSGTNDGLTVSVLTNQPEFNVTPCPLAAFAPASHLNSHAACGVFLSWEAEDPRPKQTRRVGVALGLPFRVQQLIVFVFFAAADLQRKWRSLREGFRRELVAVKSGSGQEIWKKEYIYFQQLSFLLPIYKIKEGEVSAGPAEERNTKCENQLLDFPPHLKKRKAAAAKEQVLLQTLARNADKKANPTADPDKHFLLSLLPHLKSLPDDAKLDVMGEFINILKKYRQHSTLVSQQYFSPQTNFLPGPASSGSDEDGHDLVRLPVGKKRNCVADHDKRIRTCYMCPKCDVGICPECYPTYHKKLKQ